MLPGPNVRIIGVSNPMNLRVRSNKYLFRNVEMKDKVIIYIPNLNAKGVEVITEYHVLLPKYD